MNVPHPLRGFCFGCRCLMTMRPSRRGTLLQAVVALLCLVTAGCVGPRINLWPIYFQETHATEQGLETVVEAPYPLFELHKFPNRYWYVVRPLFNYQSGPEEGAHRLQYMWPLGLQKGEGERLWYHRFWPFFVHASATRPDGQEQVHGMLFPLVFWGHRAPEGMYFAVFPLGGVTHGLFGDTFSFVAFPLYSYFRQGEYRRYNVLWPFFSIGNTPDGKEKVLRIWPFYVRKRRENTYDHTYLLWLFVSWGTEEWQAGPKHYVRHYTAVRPFYASDKTYDGDGNLVASRSGIFGSTRSWDSRPGHEGKGWTYLMTLVRYRTSPTEDEFGIIPFYWATRRRPGGPDSGRRWTRHRILWPLVWVDTTQEEDRTGTSLVLAPLYWHHETHYTAGQHAGKADRRITLWPVATWESSYDGAWRFHVASTGWHDASEGYKRNYGALFELFQVGRDPEGEKQLRLLWRLYHQRWSPAGQYLSLGPLVTYDSIGDAGAEGRKSFSCLFGLVKYHWSEGDSGWRVLYLPPGK